MPSSITQSQLLPILAAIVAFLFAALLLVYIYRLLFGRRIKAPGPRNRPRRLDIVDTFDVDGDRQLVIVRRDNVEHLLLIGGPNDLLVEASISRVEIREQRPREKEAPSAGPGWPLGPSAAPQAPAPAPAPAPSFPPTLGPASSPVESEAPKPPVEPAPPPSAGLAPLPPDLFGPPPSKPVPPPAPEAPARAGTPRFTPQRPPFTPTPRPPRPAPPPFLSRAAKPPVPPPAAEVPPPPPPAPEEPPHLPTPEPPPEPVAVEPPPPPAPEEPAPPPAEPVDPLDSLEAEMARLLGRPESKP
ncbi:hypothetical protein A1351_19995 [Methylosinus sp. R-45379]|uniref:flagellar biosynthetic protein FliO n=1 Tax=Methylosinus sp. R-45379 TaxID=980563 RepID=UPI0007C912CB|nr:flagellar biosynthetic protein FliO [Methylosinus sp. R-45379]OAI23054.1 hypothetical protein A1351_19995 [Methylosinus sp. R-45379]